MRTRLAAAALVLAAQAFAGEYAILRNGFSLRVDRHETVDGKVRLYVGQGYTEMDAASVERFETEYEAPAAAPVVVIEAPKPQLTVEQMLERAAERYGIPKKFLHSLAKAESGLLNTAVSPKGAIGIMQLMPGTARALGADPTVAEQNVEAGTRYLAELLLKYKNDPYQVRKALAAYNAGPGAVERYQGVPPYRETMQYVERVIRQSGLSQ